jgi:hypothetical protein
MWRDDLQALEFTPDGHAGRCVIHRLALRRWLPVTAAETCVAFFAEQRAAFEAAAAAKIRRRGLPPDAAFHLTSRDLAAALRA